MKLERLVIGVDFSAHSVEAARWAANQFAPRAELVLVHVIQNSGPPPSVGSRLPRRDLLIDIVRDDAEKRLREISLSLNADFVWREIREGDPVECLAAVATEFSADLVVVGAHGERPGVPEALGTTAERLVRTSARPVLLVAHPRLTPPSHLVVPVDKSEDAAGALRLAGVVSRRFGARVTPMHVLTGRVASRTLAVATAGVPRERATSEVSIAEPTREVLCAAEQLDADLIVIGRRGEGNSWGEVLGSVAEGALRGWTCPVLVVPEP